MFHKVKMIKNSAELENCGAGGILPFIPPVDRSNTLSTLFYYCCSCSSKGCQQYQGTIEVERSPCGGGDGGGSGAAIASHAYFCCDDPNRGGGGASGPAAAATGIQLNMTGHLTHYDLQTGLTACGRSCGNDDLVAAIAPGHFTAPNPNRDSVCGKRAKIVDPTTLKSVVVTVWDKCEGCGADDVDVSPAAFERLKPKTVGRFKVVWGFV